MQRRERRRGCRFPGTLRRSSFACPLLFCRVPVFPAFLPFKKKVEIGYDVRLVAVQDD